MQQGNDPSRWLRLREARTLLGVSDSTLRRWADSGVIQTVRSPGGQRWFSRLDVERLMREGTAA